MSRSLIALLTAACLLRFIAPAAGATYDWIGGSGDWTTPGNWNIGTGFPDGNDTARFTAGGMYTVSVTGSLTVGDIDWVDAGATVTPHALASGSASLTVLDDFMINGTLDLTSDHDGQWSTLLRAGMITNAASGTVNLGGTSTSASTWRQLQADQFINNGTVNVDRQTRFNRASGVLTNNADVNVASDGSLTFGSNNTFNQDGGTFNNQGSLAFVSDTLNFNGGNFSGNPVALHSSTLNNTTTGTGVFHLTGSNNYSGDLDPNQFLNLMALASGSQTTTATDDFTNRSTINITSDHNGQWSTLLRAGMITNAASGTVNLGGTSTSASTWRQLQADQFINDGTVNVDRQTRFDRTNGVFTNNANVNVASDGSLTFGSNSTFNQDGGTFDNQGSLAFVSDTLNFNGGNFSGNPVALHSSTLNNTTTGTGVFHLTGSNNYSGDLDPNQFLNLMALASGSQTTTATDDFTNRSTINITSDHNGQWSTLLRAGMITNAASGTINLGGTSASASTWRQLQADQFLNNGTVNVDRQTRFDRTNGVFTNNANVNVASDGSLTFGSNSTFNQDGGTFDNQGSLAFVSDTLNFNGGNFSGNPVALHSSTLNNNTTGTGVFHLTGSNNYSGDLDPNQFLNLMALASGSQTTTATADFTNRSTINITSDHDGQWSTLLRAGMITNGADGTINFGGTSASASTWRQLQADQFINDGTVNVDGQTRFNRTNGVFTNSGEVNINSSSLTIGDSSTLENLAGGSLRGTGTLHVGSNGLQNDGIIAPGLSVGQLNVDGDVTFGATADLKIELGGTTQATDYDFLNALDVLNLDGSLSVRFLGGFEDTASPSDIFTIVSASTLNGTFAGLAHGDRFDTTDGYGSFEVQYVGSTVQLTNFDKYLDGDFDGIDGYSCADVDSLLADIVIGNNSPLFDINGDTVVDQTDLDLWLAQAGADMGFAAALLLGDATLDGTVDGQDFLVWNANKFTNTTSWCDGNFNVDSLVDGQDFLAWNANKFTSSANAIVAIPEPTSAGLLLPLVLLYWGRRMKQPSTSPELMSRS